MQNLNKNGGSKLEGIEYSNLSGIEQDMYNSQNFDNSHPARG